MGDKMGDQATDFTSLFHSLQGDTISDRKKNFNKLLKNPAFSANKQIVQDALDKLEPKTYLEGLFKVDALIFFRHTARLLEIMKGGNEVFMSKILKQNWFFEEVFRNMDAKVLVNEFLPCLSFTMRMKVLKRLSVVMDEHKMDDIYDCVYERYGLWIATKFLHVCSNEKIQFVLKNEEVNLTVSQVQHLFYRTPVLLNIYLDYYKKTFDKMYNESKVTDQVALKDPAFLLKLKDEEKILVTNLGRRTTKHMFDLVKNDVPKNFDWYKNHLNNAVLIKKLGGGFKDIYVNNFPKQITHIDYYADCRTILKFYPKNGRWSLFANAFHGKFPNKDISETYSLLGKHIMALNPSIETIRDWAEYIYQKDHNERTLKYLPTAKAIPLIKEKINLTSNMYERGRLIKLLLQNCRKNNDLTALEEVLKYVCTRHRNEDVNFRENFLVKLHNKFELNKLNETHWKYIYEQIKILKLQKQNFCWQITTMLKRHLEFIFETGANVDQYIIEYIQFIISDQACLAPELKNPEVEKKLLIEIITIFEKDALTLSQDKKDDYIIILIRDSMNFSIQYPKYYIDVGAFPTIKTFFEKQINELFGKHDRFNQLIQTVLAYKEKFPQTSLVDNSDIIKLTIKFCKGDEIQFINEYLIKFFLKKSRTDFENELLKAYLDNIPKEKIVIDLIEWLLKSDPAVLIPYFIEICKSYPKINVRVIKSLSHFEFDRQMRTIFISLLESDDLEDHIDVVQALSFLLPANEFAELIDKKFIPDKSKLDPEDEEMCKLYDLRCTITKMLKNVEEPIKILPVVFKFCVGDYLKFALVSMQSAFYRSPEKEIYPYIMQMSKKAVSVRKHAIFLGSELLKKEYVLELLSKNESNVSSQKSRFKATLKYFRKNPCDQLNDLLITYMSTIDKNDSESLEHLGDVTVPKKYKGSYVEKCWEFYEKIQSQGVNVDKYFDKLLQCLNNHRDILKSLSSNLMEKIITEYYGKIPNTFLVGRVIVKYLDFKCDTDENLLKVFLKKLSTSKKTDLEDFHSSLQSCLKLSTGFIVKLNKLWTEYFSLINTFDETVWLNLLSLEYTSASSKNLAEKIITYMEELTTQFSLGVIGLLRDVFINYISTICNGEEYPLLDEMVKIKPTALTCILVLGALTPVGDHDPERHEIFLRITENIKVVQDSLVGIYYNLYVKTHRLE